MQRQSLLSLRVSAATVAMTSAAEADIAAGEQALGQLDYDSAYKHFDKATKADPASALASFCVDLGRFNEAEEQYNAAAKLDDENAPFYWSEFAVQYARKAPLIMEQFLDDKTRDMIRQKALTYALKALGVEKEDAKRLL